MKTYRIKAHSKKGTLYRFRISLKPSQSLRVALASLFPDGRIRLFNVEEL